MQVLVIDYGMGNLGSVRRALEECGGDVTLSRSPGDLANAERIVLPGVGAFADGMANLTAAGWPAALAEALKNPRVELLGICLGMQLLASVGHEGGTSPGLNLIAGEVVRLQPIAGERVPHVGWNEVNPARLHPILASIRDGTDFYFVHSYHFRPTDPATVVAATPYCRDFVSVIAAQNVVGTQFHPEKSSKAGFQLIRNFLTR